MSHRAIEGIYTWSLSGVLSTDGRRALSGSDDKTLKVWDLERGQCLRTLEGHGDRVSSCVVYADGRRVLSGSYDKTLKVWDLERGLCLATYTGDSGIRCCGSTPDGRRIVAGDATGHMHFLRLVGAEERPTEDKASM